MKSNVDFCLFSTNQLKTFAYIWAILLMVMVE